MKIIKLNESQINKIILKEYLSKNVGKPLDKLINGDYSFKDNMEVNGGGNFYWNGEYSQEQKEYLVKHFGVLLPDYMLEKDIDFDSEDEEMDYCEYWENMQNIANEDNEKYQNTSDNYNKNTFRCDKMTILLYEKYPNEFENFVNYILYQLAAWGSSTKYYLPNWFYLQPLDNKKGYKLIKNEWLVHFTNQDDDILKNNYFKGADINTLSITLGEDKGDYVFAFKADMLGDMIGTNYNKEFPTLFGKDFLLFQAVGMELYHSGDKYNQVIVDKNTIKNIVQVKKINNYYCVMKNNNSNETIFKNKDYSIVINWIMNNFIQYHKVINHGNFNNTNI